MREIKVLEVVYSLNAGGIETFIVNLLRNMPKEKICVDLAVIKREGEEQFYDEEIKKLGIKIYSLGDFSKGKVYKYYTVRRDLYRLYKKNQYDLVHIHSGQVDKLADMLLAKRAKVPSIIVHSHNQGLAASVKFYRMRCMLQSISRFIYSHAKVHLFSCSEAAAGWAYTKVACVSGRVKIVNNVLDCEKYTFSNEKRERVRKELGLENSFVLGHIGRFNYQKNHDFLIDVFREIHRKESNAVLLLLGTGELQETVKDKVHTYGLDASVRFVGVTDKVPDYLQAMDVFLFPSRFEGLPVVGIEVQAASLQTIASDRITSEVAISPYFRFLSLDDGAQKWAELALEYKNGYERIDTAEYIKKSGFAMGEIAKDVERCYREYTKAV